MTPTSAFAFAILVAIVVPAQADMARIRASGSHVSAIAEKPNTPLPGTDAPAGDLRCQAKPDHGPCKGIFERAYFDPKSNSCKSFDWGGCQGAVPFETIEACNIICK